MYIFRHVRLCANIYVCIFICTLCVYLLASARAQTFLCLCTTCVRGCEERLIRNQRKTRLTPRSLNIRASVRQRHTEATRLRHTRANAHKLKCARTRLRNARTSTQPQTHKHKHSHNKHTHAYKLAQELRPAYAPKKPLYRIS